MYQHILVPVDGSQLSIVTAAKACRFAKALNAKATFLNVRGDYGATDGGALVHAMSPADYAQTAAGDAAAVLAKVEVDARFVDIAYALVMRTSDRPYEAIIDVANELECDLIFMASHGVRGLKGLLMGSQTQKVLAHTRIPVLVSSVETNSLSPQMDAAVAIIKGEHRSLAAVMTGLRRVLRQSQASGSPVNGNLVRAMMFYVRRFPQALHHPKEETYLFSRLRHRNSELNSILSQLESLHQLEPGLIEAVERALGSYEASPDSAHLDVLVSAAERYCEHLWNHMSLEEKIVIPACQEAFATSDWEEIASAFAENRDPRFDKEQTSDFENFLVRIMNVASGIV